MKFSIAAFSSCVIILVVALTSIPSIIAQDCADDPTFGFVRKNGEPGDCIWLSANDRRINRYCDRGDIKGACKDTCSFCPCQDDTEFTFVLDNGNVQICEWFKRRNTATRRANYCYQNDDVEAGVSSAIGDKCVDGCGFCTEGTAAPTKAPTENPSKAPTKAPTKTPTANPTDSDSTPSASPTRPPSPMPSPFPTLRPTNIPSDSPSEKPSNEPSVAPSEFPSDSPSTSPSVLPSDSPSEKPSNEPSVAPSEVPSILLSQRPSDFPSDKPSKAPSDEPSLEPSGFPSDRPTNNPSSEPTVSPTGNPTSSIKPSPSPSASPTKSPATVPTKAPTTAPTKAPSKAPTEAPTAAPTSQCADDSTFEFVRKNGLPGDCIWLGSRDVRINRYCDRGDIKGACQDTCSFCPCVDTPGYTFERPDNGRVRDCPWITGKSIRKRFCFEDYESGTGVPSDVGNNCVEACGFCRP